MMADGVVDSVSTPTVLSRELSLAAFRGDVAVVRAYLHGNKLQQTVSSQLSKLNAFSEEQTGTLLIFAACGCQVALVDDLLRANASINLQDRWGCTALSAACCPVEYQPFRHAWLAQQDPDGDHCESSKSPTAAEELLVPEQLSVSHSLARGAVLEKLLLSGADPNVVDAAGFTPLIVSSIFGAVRCVRLLLRHGARHDYKDAAGKDARAHALENDQPAIARLLSQHVPRKPGSGAPRLDRSSGSSVEFSADRSVGGSIASTVDSCGSSASTYSAHTCTEQEAEAAAVELLAQEAAEVAGANERAEKARRRKAKKQQRRAQERMHHDFARVAVSSHGQPGDATAGEQRPASSVITTADGSGVTALYTRSALPTTVEDPPPPVDVSLQWELPEGDQALVGSAPARDPSTRGGNAFVGFSFPTALPDANGAKGSTASAGSSEGSSSGGSARQPPPAAQASAAPADVPAELVCPITVELMTDPVVTADGHTYERAAIQKWLERRKASPITGEPLAHVHLTPNHTVRGLCRRYLEEGHV